MTDWKTLTLKISPDEHKQIKRLSVETERSIKDLMMECLQRLIKEYEEAQDGKTDD
ncbi:MAG: ribbon-helix-helix domain-containing protein [Desulfovermiculus sp.]